MYDLLIIANEFLKRASDDWHPLMPMQLNNLVYLANQRSYARYHRLLISEEIEIRPCGPVVRTVYDEFRRFNGNPINAFITGHEPEFATEEVPLIGAGTIEQAKDAFILDEIWDAYCQGSIVLPYQTSPAEAARQE